MQSAASAGGRDAAGRERRHRQLALARHEAHQVEGRAERLGLGGKLVLAHRVQPPDLAVDPSQVAHRLGDVAGPRLALGPDQRRPLGDPPQRLAQVARAADEGRLEVGLVDGVLLVGRGSGPRSRR
jgi:hypothetical protein